MFSTKKPNSPDIKKRKSFRKFLKGSPDIQRSSRFNNSLIHKDDHDDSFFELHPIGTTTEEASENDKQPPVIVNEDNIIQELGVSAKKLKSKKSNNILKASTQGKFIRPAYYNQDAQNRKSLSLARVAPGTVPISEREEIREVPPMRINSFKYDDQRLNLEGAKRRNKNSKKFMSKSNYKWNLLSTDQNYNSNLPQIGKTRTHISSDCCSLEQISIDAIYRNKRQNNNVIQEQAYNENGTNPKYFSSANSAGISHNSTNKKTKISLEKDMFIQNILKGVVETKALENHEYQLSNRDGVSHNYNTHKKLLRKRSERTKRSHGGIPGAWIETKNIPLIHPKNTHSINY